MKDIIISIVGSVGVIGLLMFLARNWFIERLRLSIKFEYDEKLEKLRANLLVENQAAIEKQKELASKELENVKNELKIASDEYATVLGGNASAYTIIWIAIEELLSSFTGIFNLYVESYNNYDETILQKCVSAKEKVEKSLAKTALVIGQHLTEEINEILGGYQHEISALGHCIYMKKVKAGILPKSKLVDSEYEFYRASQWTRDKVRSLKERCEIIKTKIRNKVDNRNIE